MSDTPIIDEYAGISEDFRLLEVVSAEVARKIERELAELKQSVSIKQQIGLALTEKCDELQKELTEARAEIERLKAPTSTENIDERMIQAGMLSVTQLLQGTPIEKFCANVDVVSVDHFEQWILMRRKEILKMQAAMMLDKKELDEMYEWVVSHSAVLAEVLANFRQVKPEIDRKDALIKQMLGTLQCCRDKFSEYVKIHKAKIPEFQPAVFPSMFADAEEKVKRNQDMVDLCDVAIEAAKGGKA